jgi:NADH:ubiquinone oxidoreductase subunit 3 (subunit A)
MLIKFRKAVAMILMILGIAMLFRGIWYSVNARIGLQGLVPALIVGCLVFALGFYRWRYLSQR